MDGAGVMFDADGAQRIIDVVRHVEDNSPALKRPTRKPVPSSANVQLLRVTGTSTAGPGSLACYPARLRQLDPSAGTWADVTGTDDLWYVQPSGSVVTDGTGIYLARQIGDVTAGAVQRPTFVAVAAGSGTNACPDAPTIPGGFTCLDDSCCLPPLLEAQRSAFDGQCYYRWVIVCLYNGKFHTCQGAWTTTYPTSDPYGVPIPDPSGAEAAAVFPDAVFPTPVFPAPVFP